MGKRMSRRTFLQGSAIATGVTVLSDPFSARTYAQNAKVRFANFGVGGRGDAHVGPAASQNLVAACDCNKSTAEKVAAKHKAKAYSDWRKVFDEMMKEFDGVFVATPDHSHFPIAYTAVKNGKHCYCEKPLTHGVWEARTLATLVKEKKVATQMGNQGHANEGNRRIVEWVQSGIIGEIKEVHAWTNRPIWPQGIDRPEGTPPCPADLDWEAFIGVAPMRPYHPDYQPFKWRGWKDYGCGAVGDMGCHTWDCVWWSMEAKAPLSAELLKIEGRKPETFPKKMVVKWEFDKTEKRPGFIAFWYEGGWKPEGLQEVVGEGKKLPGSGDLFIGTKGKILVEGDYGDKPRLLPAELKEAGDQVPKSIPRSPGHHEEFLKACRGEEAWDFPKSNFMYGGPLVEAMNLANVAMWLDKKISWDPATLKCPGTPEADALIKREYRPGWVTI
jgi:predicted dehydrogenase